MKKLSIFRVNTIVVFRNHDVRIILPSYDFFNGKGNFCKDIFSLIIYGQKNVLRQVPKFNSDSYARMQFLRTEKVDDKVNVLSN